MNFNMKRHLKNKQTGAATLLVTVVLLSLITLVSVYITKLGLLEAKTGANANRAKEALHHAQAGLDYGAMMHLDQGNSYAGGTISVAGTSVAISAIASGGLYTITASGESIDGTGAAQVEEGYGRFPIADFGKLPPLMSNGNFPPSGSFSIVTNPNGGGTGVPVSAWVEQSAAHGVGSWDSCNWDEFYYQGQNAAKAKTLLDGFLYCAQCECSKADDKLCTASNGVNPGDCEDVVVEAGIPDVFENVFKISVDEWETYRDLVAVQNIACNALDEDTGDIFKSGGEYEGRIPLIWITGTCSIGGQIGSPDAPIVLVVHGDLTISANSVFFGIAMSFSDDYTTDGNGVDGEDFTLKTNGNSTVYGILLSNKNVDLPNGTFNLIYSKDVLENLGDSYDGEEFMIGRRTGSWNDLN